MKCPLRENDEQVLRRALRLHERCWTELQKGASDEQIAEHLAALWDNGQVEAQPGGRPCAVRGRPHPALWLDTAVADLRRKAPAYIGPRLIAAVRRVAQIPAPREVVRQKNGQEHHSLPTALRIEETCEVPLTLLKRSPFQTRDEPPAAWLQEIVASLQADGQLTSCLVRRVESHFELLAGHTRLAAAKQLHWPTLRCDITTCDDATAAKIVYLENAKRRDLTVIERARGLARLRETYQAAGLTQAQAAKDAGLSESQFSNLLRLLRLPETFQARLVAGELTIEQARSLVTYAGYDRFFQGFLEYLAKHQLGTGPLVSPHFEEACRWGLNKASRPMTSYADGRGCLFRPSPAQASQLDIREVIIHGVKERRAFNVKLWNQLQRAAKTRRQAKFAEQRAMESGSTSDSGQRRDTWQFEYHLKRAWCQAYIQALRPQVARGRLSKPQRTALLRFAVLYQLVFEEVDDDAESVGQLFSLTDSAWDARCLEIVRRHFTTSQQPDNRCNRLARIPLDAWQVLADYFALDQHQLAVHFRMTPGLLEACGDHDLRQIVRAFGLESTGTRQMLLARLESATWPPPEWPACLQCPAHTQAY